MNMNACAYASGRRHQSGASLIISLVVLGVLMLMGVAAMVISNTQYRLAGNLQFQNTALNNAEVALATAEQWLSTGTNFTAAGFDTYDVSTPMLYPGTYLADNNIDALTMAWSDTNSAKADASGNQRYLIEQLAKSRKLTGSGLGVGGRRSTSCNEVNVYRITTRGVSGRGATRFVQAIFSVLSCPV